MTFAAFDKRILFNAMACNTGHDCLQANAWYCGLTKKERKDTPLQELLDRMTDEELGLDKPSSPNPLPGFSAREAVPTMDHTQRAEDLYLAHALNPSIGLPLFD